MSENQMKAFARLVKVDEAKRLVTGILANEAVDYAGEVFDYATSVPYFKAWSETVQKATNGASVGNLRAQHGQVVAGKIEEMVFDDATKSISITANVVDDNEWKKVLAGCYTGFSVGGKYANKWDDADLGKKRYTGNPSEASIVDLACNPDASFTVIKAAGGEELRKYATPSEAVDAAVAVQNETLVADLRKQLDELPAEAPEALRKYIGELIDASEELLSKYNHNHAKENGEFASGSGGGGGKDDRLESMGIKAAQKRLEAAIKKAGGANKLTGADKRLQTQVRNYFLMGPSRETATTISTRARKALDDGQLTAFAGEALAKKVADKDEHTLTLLKLATTLAPESADTLEKGLWDASRLCELLMSLSCTANSVAYEEATEKDGSDVSAQLVGAMRQLGQALIALVNEEVAEMLVNYEGDAMATAVPTGDLKKDGGEAATAANEQLLKSFGELLAKQLEPMNQANADLKKSVDSLTEKTQEQANEIAALKKAVPQPGGARLTVVDKGDELRKDRPSGEDGDKVAPITDNAGKEDVASTLIKQAHASGGQPLMKPRV